MKLTETHSSQNGYHKASPGCGEAFVVPARPAAAAFPSETIPFSMPLFFYNLTHFTWGDMWLIRLPQAMLMVVALLWATGGLPGRWWGTVLALALLVLLYWCLRRWRQSDFVTFVATTPPAVSTQRLDPKEKIPVHVTGRFTVENKIRRFTWLPGFYRTFATREHALLCQVASRSFLWLARWPEAEVGLWYIFFTPSVIQQIQWGDLCFGKHSRPALAVTYLLPAATAKARRGEMTETVYLAVPNPEDCRAILADLLVDLSPAVLAAARPSLSAHR